MILRRPKHKKSIKKRLEDTILRDELNSFDVSCNHSYYTKEELNNFIEDDKPMEYYSDEVAIFWIAFIIVSIILFILVCVL